jgi:uncharacterized membrane protein YGL010W
LCRENGWLYAFIPSTGTARALPRHELAPARRSAEAATVRAARLARRTARRYRHAMRSMQQWLDEYGESHRHPTNKAVHRVCVPAIMFTVLGLLWLLPVPAIAAALGPWANWATLVVALAAIWYLLLSPPLALGMLLISLGMLAAIAWLDATLPFPSWILFVAVFVAAWIGQFIGHRIEGRKPSFFKDVQFLLIGPAWLLSHLYGRRRVPAGPPRSTG